MPVKTTAALGLLVVCGPILMFPDLLPVSSRVAVVTVITSTALGLALLMLQVSNEFKLGLWLFVAALIGSWAFMPVHDLLGLRHFAGVGAGILAMALVASWCTRTDRLLTATGLFALASIGILTAGLLGTSINALKFVGHTPLLESPPFTWLPEFKLGLPGLEGNGQVNSNALGGTALMLLPTCGALTAAAFIDRHHRRLMLAIGIIATVVAIAALGLTLSRTAWVAALLTLVVWGLRWRRGRPWLFLAVLLAAGGLVVAANRWRGPLPVEGMAILSAQSSLGARMAIWHDAIDRLLKAPWFGVGINQFHDVVRTPGPDGTNQVPHAHNTLIQVALDVGLPGLCGYVLFFGALVFSADRAARHRGVAGRIAGGAALSIVAVHLFGLGDAIALGAKVGLFQWLCAGLLLAALHQTPPTPVRTGSLVLE